MKNAFKALMFFIPIIGLSGCGTFVPVVKMSDVPADQIHESNKILLFTVGQSNHPEIGEYLGNITAYSCKHMLWDPPSSSGDALAQLRIKALELKADAITDVTVNERGTDAYGTNCWNSVQASGIAVKFKK